MDTNKREQMKNLTTATRGPRSETFKEGIRSLWVLCVSVVNLVFIRDHSCPFAVGLLSRVYPRPSAVEFLFLRGGNLCGLES